MIHGADVVLRQARASWACGLIALVALGCFCAPVAAEPLSPLAAAAQEQHVSDAAHRLAAWVMQTQDNHGHAFVIVDKVNAQALAYDADGMLLGAAPVLLGAAQGDESVPDIGARALANIPTDMRITPAGRYIATLGVNLAGHEVLWIDYAAALSLHSVVPGTPAEHRAQRLSSPTALDNRISFGCINVPRAFFDSVVRPLFSGVSGTVYILPETRTLDAVFFRTTGHANTSQ